MQILPPPLDIPLFDITTFRESRRLKRISQKELAHKTGLSIYKIREFERGNSTLKPSKVNELQSIINPPQKGQD